MWTWPPKARPLHPVNVKVRAQRGCSPLTPKSQEMRGGCEQSPRSPEATPSLFCQDAGSRGKADSYAGHSSEIHANLDGEGLR